MLANPFLIAMLAAFLAPAIGFGLFVVLHLS